MLHLLAVYVLKDEGWETMTIDDLKTEDERKLAAAILGVLHVSPLFGEPVVRVLTVIRDGFTEESSHA